MASPSDSISMALFCDFENVALGVRDAQFEKFDIKPILERLLLKGSIVVKKSYCDWERYKGFKATMHEANFELIEIPHVRQSGKNSADIRLVVDALDLCYTKSHVNTFVIISGDSDFSPLVSKLRENNKQVIGVGVKQSTSDLLIANCDEFIFYDDLVREKQRALARRQSPGAAPAPRRTPEEERSRKESQDVRRTQGVELAVETFEALTSERGDSGKIWASVLKEAIKRRKPDFSEGYYGFRTFGNLLEEAQARGMLEFGRDEKSGAYVFRSLGGAPDAAGRADASAERQGGAGYFRHDFHAVASVPADAAGGGGRSRGRRGEGTARSERPQHANERQDFSAQGRVDPDADARDDAQPERPGGSYFSQQAPVVLAPEVDAGLEGENDERTTYIGLVEAPASTPVKSVDTEDASPAPRSRRSVSTPRKSAARTTAKVKAKPGATPAATAPKTVASAPAKVASKSRVRKPRSPGDKSSEPTE
ncbi:NYN domain-containing protein [Acidovorax sp.]|uniref:NYN domain-containing protein n=1 Tax=Acidovorax sp. TaxID=1872122 RepID=UPI00260D6EE3|nr:NYN domain-containing protein [Acidovorax sp.]